MLTEISESQFREIFPTNPNPFLESGFLKLNSNKVEKVIFLTKDEKAEIGFVLGVRNNALYSPFSAPFGGIHYKKENVYTNIVDEYLELLRDYVEVNHYEKVLIVLAPDIYGQTFNSKLVSSLYRVGYSLKTPEITSYIDLSKYEGRYTQKNSREYYRQAQRNNLKFELSTSETDKHNIFNLICDNRAHFGRPIYMTLNDIEETGQLWLVDYFKVEDQDGLIASSAIFYRFHNEIVYAVFWGDNEHGRPLRAMDFMLLNLWDYYKKLGYKYIDLGISTEEGVPNAGLLRFKESHEAESSLRFRFEFNNSNN